jgi:chloride channel protein, CIC family
MEEPEEPSHARKRRGGVAALLRRRHEHVLELYAHLANPYLPRIVLLGALVGAIGGLGAVALHYLVLGATYIFLGASSADTFLQTVRELPWQYRLVAPALGGLIVGPAVTYLVKEARGHGVPEVMEAVFVRGGTIRLPVAPVKALTTAISIGSGGSAGIEGPIV